MGRTARPAACLALISRSVPVKFGLEAVYIDPGWPVDVPLLEDFCRSREVDFHVVKPVLLKSFSSQGAKIPVPFVPTCAGELHNKALELGCGKVALGTTWMMLLKHSL